MVVRRAGAVTLLLFLLALGANGSPLFHHTRKTRGAALSGDRWIRQDAPPTDDLGKAVESDRLRFSFFASQNLKGIGDGFVATFTTDDEPHWQMYRNFRKAAEAQGLSVVTFVLKNDSLPKCQAILAACFWPGKTLEFFYNQTVLAGKPEFVLGGEEVGSEGHRAAAALKPTVLYLSSTLQRDFLFAETGAAPAAAHTVHASSRPLLAAAPFAERTPSPAPHPDVVLTGNALAHLSARPEHVTTACAADGRGPREGDRPHGGVDLGVVFSRAGPLTPPAFRRLLTHLAWHPNDSERWMLKLSLEGLSRRYGQEHGCVGAADGFVTAEAAAAPPGPPGSACFATHAAGQRTAQGKIRWLREQGLWFLEPGAPPVPTRSAEGCSGGVARAEMSRPPPGAGSLGSGWASGGGGFRSGLKSWQRRTIL